MLICLVSILNPSIPQCQYPIIHKPSVIKDRHILVLNVFISSKEVKYLWEEKLYKGPYCILRRKQLYQATWNHIARGFIRFKCQPIQDPASVLCILTHSTVNLLNCTTLLCCSSEESFVQHILVNGCSFLSPHVAWKGLNTHKQKNVQRYSILQPLAVLVLFHGQNDKWNSYIYE